MVNVSVNPAFILTKLSWIKTREKKTGYNDGKDVSTGVTGMTIDHI